MPMLLKLEENSLNKEGQLNKVDSALIQVGIRILSPRAKEYRIPL